MEGIYVPGNAKAEINKDATAGAVDGTNPQITGGLDMGSQLIAGGVNGVVNATKQAASKNIKKVKVTIKTNYAVFLMEKKNRGKADRKRHIETLNGVYSRHEQSGQRSDEKASVDEKQKSRIMVRNLKSKQ